MKLNTSNIENNMVALEISPSEMTTISLMLSHVIEQLAKDSDLSPMGVLNFFQPEKLGADPSNSYIGNSILADIETLIEGLHDIDYFINKFKKTYSDLKLN